MRYFHVDVFSARPLGGNGLAVVFPDRAIDDGELQSVAREFNQFETSFVYPVRGSSYPVRVFTVEEELPFAGHPLLGSAAMIHHVFHRGDDEIPVTMLLGSRRVSCLSRLRQEDGQSVYSITMNQDAPEYVSAVDSRRAADIAVAVGLHVSDLDARYPLEVVSTGLPYLLVPLRAGIDRVRVAHPDFEKFLSGFGAKFAYFFDTATLECRTWDNAGRVEDVATGSAAGPLAAYLVKNGYRAPGETINLSQGSRVGRPSRIECWLDGGAVFIRGDVAIFAEGACL